MVDLYKRNSLASSILWSAWCSSSPMTIDALVDESSEGAGEVRREVLYYCNSDLLIPVRYEGTIAFVFNPAIEWMIAVGELVRQYSREELEQELRDAKAECRVQSETTGVYCVDSYVEAEDEVSYREVSAWVVADAKVGWVEDAIAVYDVLETICSLPYEEVEGAEMERFLEP